MKDLGDQITIPDGGKLLSKRHLINPSLRNEQEIQIDLLILDSLALLIERAIEEETFSARRKRN